MTRIINAVQGTEAAGVSVDLVENTASGLATGDDVLISIENITTDMGTIISLAATAIMKLQVVPETM